MKTSAKLMKTSYEENNEICNYQLGNVYVDLSEERTNPGTLKSRNLATPKNEDNFKDEFKRKSSKKKTRKNSSQSNENVKANNTTLIDLVDNLKEKLTLYENEIRSLIEEKVQMQVQINSLQLNSYQNLKKSGKFKKSGDFMLHSIDSASNQNHIEETNQGLKSELNNLNEQITRQKRLLDQNFSILNDTIKNDDFDRNNQPNKNGNIDFDVSKMSDVSGLVSEIIENKKRAKNEKDVNCSLDLSDDG